MLQIICGNEPYLKDAAVRKISEAFSEYQIRKYSVWTKEIRSELNEDSFFGSSLVVLKCDDLPKEDDFLKLLSEDFLGTLLVVPKSTDTRRKTYKVAKEKGFLCEYNKPGILDVRRFIRKVFSAEAENVSEDLINLIISRSGYYDDDTVSLYTLEIYCKKILFSGNISVESVIDIVPENVQAKAYELFNNIGGSGYWQAVEALLKDGSNYIGLLSAMLSAVKTGYKMALYNDEPKKLREAGVQAWGVRRKLSVSEWGSLLRIFTNAVADVKSGKDGALVFSMATARAEQIILGSAGK